VAQPDNAVRLVLSGRSFEGWTDVQVTRSMEAGAGSFQLAVTQRFPLQPAKRIVKSGEACEVRLGEDVVITGYVDSTSTSLGARQHEVSVRGRDRVGDLIDCASPDVPSDFFNLSLTEIAAALAAPFGISVRAEVDVGARFKKHSVNVGTRGFEAIEQLCRYRQVLPLSDGRGGLVLTRAGLERATGSIVEGQNLLAGSAENSMEERFSRYVVAGQTFDIGEGELRASAPSVDKDVPRYRAHVIVADDAVDTQRCQERARWEALTRAARGDQARVTVQGWRDQAGKLWRPNTIVPVSSPALGLSGDFLITEVSSQLGSGGTTTAINLMRPDAFQVQPGDETSQGEFLADIPPAEG
jgi:prophage tail gpP-like protein